MLVVRRRQGEVICIGGDVELELLSIGKTSVRLGIHAPRSVTVRMVRPATEGSERNAGSEKIEETGRSVQTSGAA